MVKQSNPDLLLASASPRRSELLRQIGVQFAVMPVDIDATRLPGEPHRTCAKRLEGSFSGVVGLPLAETGELLKAPGVPWWK